MVKHLCNKCLAIVGEKLPCKEKYKNLFFTLSKYVGALCKGIV